jgi:hypothetical protein
MGLGVRRARVRSWVEHLVAVLFMFYQYDMSKRAERDQFDDIQ